jgi:hypothetical protein
VAAAARVAAPGLKFAPNIDSAIIKNTSRCECIVHLKKIGFGEQRARGLKQAAGRNYYRSRDWLLFNQAPYVKQK